ncbi:Bax inhibitor-1/YccA family protein [Sulfitobacter sp. KE34]|uniref:Bax inhibitor-1/YccA family protein n=1 Tax=Sulfitobacter faviae TaxID=1775881 RepID=A0AAX3LM05_9RHOB|nr:MULTISPECIES: Bax inhibitor-1/YccA family protein [Sulfitobacter]MDF3348904.1 Bax inhibitor-1/YccA family protein [Sulfitobacter sp. KE12]MDF3352575.1 Bax inhibitor-1/YccA family protein [Sulfitobacter sp. KE27]MDF3356222.1 Bax inhibitor-1/YccA family protein [Sulfitobacter sp. KE33]MDF3360650.1 Bax inhibitor-1/YccA family protein [Sulfitobacter sp. Ks41]MDF3363646.1 Bax inhibitor-1/YccA family protein [Sulfitobacter sp. Ks34]
MADVNSIRSAAGSRISAIDEGLRAHMNKVYGTMSIGMLITFAAAWAISGLSVTTDPSAAVAQLSQDKYLTQLGYALYASPLKWVVMFAPLAFVFGFGAMINRMSAATAQVVFYAFAAVMGISISSIFLVFTGYSIAQVFLITSIAFAGLSLWGYTTKKDISGWGSFLIMGVIGLVVASIVNIFLASSALMFAISAIGVLIFAGLTAYDTQKIKTEYLAHAHHGDTEWLGKAAIMGALSLYLDFINMFMMLLSLFGNRE